MADIKQAAKWMEQRKNVRRRPWEKGFFWQKFGGRVYEVEDGVSNRASVFTSDLIADDWEIAE